MGKDFISVKQNGRDLKSAFDRITRRGTRKVVSASEEKYFFKFPDFPDVEDIMIGSSGTKVDVIQLKDEGFIEVER